LILLDTSGLLAALLPHQPHHAECARALAHVEPPYILSPFVAAEIDYFLLKFAGVDGELLFLDELRSGIYEFANFALEDLAAGISVIEQYRSLRVGLADASIVVLAERYGTRGILTLDERHFRALRPLTGRKSFRLLPADL
jgi:uncharacterized protein